MKTFDEAFEELNRLLDTPEQNWFFGAGISANANVPLMVPLTNLVEQSLKERGKGQYRKVFEKIRSTLDDNAHVEHVLSHLGDLIALAQRSSRKCAYLSKRALTLDVLEGTYKEIIHAIAIAIRCGYRQGESGSADLRGTIDKPIVEINDHLNFIDSLLSVRANLEDRSRVTFFTTNYDTLLEDALALRQRHVIDGFWGGSTGFWDPSSFNRDREFGVRCHRVYKLHGSIDWLMDDERRLVRARYGPKYFDSDYRILIYPQATKYVETQKDPFSTLFQEFRRALNSDSSNILAICGYSFGDDHVNAEIELALTNRGNKCTVISFCRELTTGSGSVLPPILEKWRTSDLIGNRVYIASDRALYANRQRFEKEDGRTFNWWRFTDLGLFLHTRSI